MTDTHNNSFFEQNPIPMWIEDITSSRIVKVNNAALVAYGYTQAQMLKMTRAALSLPEGLSQSMPTRPEGVRTESGYVGVSLHQGQTGVGFFVKLYTQSISAKGKRAKLVTAVNVDLEVRAEQAQQKVNQQAQSRLQYLQSLMEHQTSYFILRFSLDGLYTYVNPALCHRLGIKESDMVGTSAFDNIFEEDALAAENAVHQCIQNVGQPFPVRIRRYMLDGTLGVGDYEMVAIADQEGNVTEIQSMGIEVTEKLKYMEKMTAYKHRLEVIMKSITDGFYALDNDWKFTYVNDTMAASLSQSPEALVGQSVWTFLPEKEKAEFKNWFNQALIEQKSIYFQSNIVEHQIWVSVIAYPTPEGLSVFWRDITVQKLAEEKVNRQEARLKKIAWVQSHKVRAPLASILGLIQIFNKQNPADPFNIEVLEMLETSSQQLDLVIHEVIKNTVVYSNRRL